MSTETKPMMLRFLFLPTRCWLICLFCTLLLPVPLVHAGDALTIDSDGQFTYAMHLFTSGDYTDAITELNRFIYFFPEDERVPSAHYTIGHSFFLQKQYREAIGSFTTAAGPADTSPVAVKSAWMISQCHLELHEPGAAIVRLRNLAAVTKDIDILDKTYYRLGWIYLDGAHWHAAGTHFSKISDKNALDYQREQLASAISRHRSIPLKNPTLAGWLSILPGGGQLYCHRYHDALVAFLINGGLIWAACESFDRDLNALGALLGIAELGFYSGNIYSAVNSAHKYNRSKTQSFIENIRRNTRVNLSAIPGERGLLLSFNYRF